MATEVAPTSGRALAQGLHVSKPRDKTDLERILLLFRLEFRDPADAIAEMAGRPVYLGLACRDDRRLRMKPQNLLTNLPLARSAH